MKSDRKRLKAEKLDLLSQLRHLYAALEDKDGEIREFIRKFEQRMRESDLTIKQVNTDTLYMYQYIHIACYCTGEAKL